MPKELEDRGYTGEVVTLHLRNKMNDHLTKIQKYDSSSKNTGNNGDGKDETNQKQEDFQQAETDMQMDIELPGVGLSLRAVALHIMQAFNIESGHKQVHGYIIKEKGKDELQFTVHVHKKPAKTFTKGNIEEAIKEAAEYLLKTLEPQKLGMLYYSNDDDKKLASLIQHVWQNNPSVEEKAMAMLLEGHLAKLKGNMSKARDRFKAAKSLDKKNIMVLYMFGEMLGKDGK